MQSKKARKLLMGVLVLLIIGASCTILWIKNKKSVDIDINVLTEQPIYEVVCEGDYGFDKYLKVGSEDMDGMIDFVLNNIKNVDVEWKGQDKEERGCSAFLAQTPEGDVILARDLDQFVDNVAGVLHTLSNKDYKSIGMCNMCWCGWPTEFQEPTKRMNGGAILAPYVTMDGINEHGLAVAFLTAEGEKLDMDESKVTLYDLAINRLVLDKATTVQEAIELIKQYNVTWMAPWTSHYMIADANGNSAVVEFVDGKMQVVEKEGPYQICSNFILYNNPERIGYGKDRYEAYETALESKKGIVTIDEAFKLLEENTIPNAPKWSVVFNLTKKTMDVTVYPNYDKIYHYAFEDSKWVLKE